MIFEKSAIKSYLLNKTGDILQYGEGYKTLECHKVHRNVNELSETTPNDVPDDDPILHSLRQWNSTHWVTDACPRIQPNWTVTPSTDYSSWGYRESGITLAGNMHHYATCRCDRCRIYVHTRGGRREMDQSTWNPYRVFS